MLRIAAHQQGKSHPAVSVPETGFSTSREVNFLHLGHVLLSNIFLATSSLNSTCLLKEQKTPLRPLVQQGSINLLASKISSETLLGKNSFTSG